MEGSGFITPIKLWDSIGEMSSETQHTAAVGAGASLFKDIFKNTVNDVRETQADVEHKQYLLSTGQLDDVHSLPIAEAKAGLSVEVLITLRNKMLESYNEIIKMSV